LRTAESFFAEHHPRALQSARLILAYVFALFAPRSVVDVGCGTGAWLLAAQELGARRIVGVDAEYIRPYLQVPPDCFVGCDLNTGGLHLEGTFDLAVCAEVAEHLREEAAGGLIEGLARSAPAVLFSAAIPGQGGDGHVNERWLDYWSELFSERGYGMIDCIRRRFWTEPGVVYHYAQNMVLFADQEWLAQHPEVAAADDPLPPRLVHPDLFRQRVARPPSLGMALRELPQAARITLHTRLRSARRT
jgi:SAM-dependent methyltransferase